MKRTPHYCECTLTILTLTLFPDTNVVVTNPGFLQLWKTWKSQGIYSGKLGDLKYTQGIFVYQMLLFVTQTSWSVSFRGYSSIYVTMLLKNMFCNSARKVPKCLLR